MKNSVRLVVGVALISLGLYIFLTAQPDLVYRVQADNSTKTEVNTAALAPNNVYIPKISRIFEYRSGGLDVLEQGGWHRYPERGSPGEGNFIIAAHRYRSGLSPWEVIDKSPLYYIDRLEPGDEIIVSDENSMTYVYTVDTMNTVEPTASEIERQTESHILTMYTCTKQGALDGRVVLTAKLES